MRPNVIFSKLYLIKIITYVTERAKYDLRYAIDLTKLNVLVWEPSLQFKYSIEKTLARNLKNKSGLII